MSYQVLARKWRPKRFQDVTGQNHITKSLQGSLKAGKLSGAYLFSGTRGIGKTTAARILAQAARCSNITEDLNPCGSCDCCEDSKNPSSMNAIELDGASNNSVDDIREIVSNVNYLPTVGSKKVYIIDEVHMLSQSAFNALLKTLEEPPEHVIFILATTDPQKVIPTVLSRCQRFDFKTLKVNELVEYLKFIAKQESIVFETEAIIERLCEKGDGSVRDCLSLLEQVLCYADNNQITEDTISISLGLVKSTTIQSLINSLWNEDLGECNKAFADVIAANVSLKTFIKDFLKTLFNEIIEASYPQSISKSEAFWVYETLSKDFTWALTSILPEQTIQLIFQKVASRSDFFLKDQSQTVKKNETKNVVPNNSQAVKIEKNNVESAPVISEKAEEVARPVANEPQPEKNKSNTPISDWDSFLIFLKDKSQAAVANLEQGNIITPIRNIGGKVYVELGFSKSSLVFYDYLTEGSIREKIRGYVAEYFKTKIEDVTIDFKKVAAEKNFMSKADIKRKKTADIKEEKLNSLKNNPMLIKAEEIFKSKIDKVKLK